MALVSLYHHENTLGLLGLEFLEAERYFSADEIALLEKTCIDINLLRDKARLSERSQALIVVEERSRLARDLHTGDPGALCGQPGRRSPATALAARSKRAQASLEELRHLTRGALAEMRTVLLDLRPAAVVKRR